MSTIALIVAAMLAAQVGATGGRYPTTDNTGGGSASTSTPPPVAEAATGGELKKIEPPPGFAGAETNTPQATGNPPITPLRDGTAPAATGDAPSAYRSLQSQLPGAPSATPPTGSANVPPKPSAMMKQMLSAPPGSQLSGTPVRLQDVIASGRTRHEQAHRIEAYWDLCSSVADYYLGVREQEDFRNLQQTLPQLGAVLQQAQVEFDVRLGTSRLAAVASQRRLASMINSASLPLPADLPHCGSYQTRYEEIFSKRPAVEAQELAALLSLRYAELKAAATGVIRAKVWADEVAQNDSGQRIETLRALELLALRRRAFVQIARDYNRRISRYTELSTPGEIGAERLVGMLIKVSTPPTATRPTLPTGTNGRQSRRATSAPPRTFAGTEGWESASQSVAQGTRRDESVRHASAEEKETPREERSLLVTPR
jgi:hypothetical protein